MADANESARATGIPHWQADCARCSRELSDRLVADGTITWAESLAQPMWVCPLCGNKRCAKASFHGHECDRGDAEVARQQAQAEQDRAEIERRGITRRQLIDERLAAFMAE